MKVVILAGGLGTRLSEETHAIPKPMVEIGGRPILWHIMKIFSTYGFNDFIICCGYKGYVIKEYFLNYFHHNTDFTVNLEDNSLCFHKKGNEKWKVTLVDTGDATQTGGRLKRVSEYLPDDKNFLMTYGDGLADINIKQLVNFHLSHVGCATLTSVAPPGRFGALKFIDKNKVARFTEKPSDLGSRINGGFFVLNKSVLKLIKGDDTIWEIDPLQELSEREELFAFEHNGFWQPMDTLREKRLLEEKWASGKAPWQIW